MLPPRLTARWAAAQIKDLVAAKTPHLNRTPSTRRVAVVSPKLLDKEKERQKSEKVTKCPKDATSTTHALDATSKTS